MEAHLSTAGEGLELFEVDAPRGPPALPHGTPLPEAALLLQEVVTRHGVTLRS